MGKSIHPRSAHKYLRIETKGRQSVGTFRWRCVKPGCMHYLLEQFIVGAVAECWRCEREFVIEKATALKKPHCRECTRRKNLVEEAAPEPIPESPI